MSQTQSVVAETESVPAEPPKTESKKRSAEVADLPAVKKLEAETRAEPLTKDTIVKIHWHNCHDNSQEWSGDEGFAVVTHLTKKMTMAVLLKNHYISSGSRCPDCSWGTYEPGEKGDVVVMLRRDGVVVLSPQAKKVIEKIGSRARASWVVWDKIPVTDHY